MRGESEVGVGADGIVEKRCVKWSHGRKDVGREALVIEYVFDGCAMYCRFMMEIFSVTDEM